MVEFGILGPVQVVRDGRVLGLGGPRRRAVLALLLVAGGRVVPAEVARLGGALDEAGACARRALRYYQDRQMVPLAERARVLIDSLGPPGRTPAGQLTRGPNQEANGCPCSAQAADSRW